MQSLGSPVCVCVCAHTHIYTRPCMHFFQTLTVPPYLQLSPFFIERLSKEQNGKISVFLVVVFFTPKTSCLLELPTLAANLFNEAVVCC